MADLNLSSVRLPPAFQECEYIESHGSEYIDTRHIPSANDAFYIDYVQKINANGVFGSTYGGWSSNPNYWVYLKIQNGEKEFDIWSFHTYQSFRIGTSLLNVRIKITIDLLNKKAELMAPIVATKTLSVGNAHGDQPPVKLFGGEALTDATVYSFRIYRNNEIQRDYVPCYLKTDWNNIPAGTIGMYDLCGSLSSNGTPFYVNEGTGAFTKGSDVVHADSITINGADVDRLTDATGTVWTKHGLMLPSAFQRCEWIDTNGRGNRRIDIPYSFTVDKVHTQVLFTDVNNQQNLCTTCNNSSENYPIGIYFHDVYKFGFWLNGYQMADKTRTPVKNKWYEFTITQNDNGAQVEYEDGSVFKNNYTYTPAGQGVFTLFARNRNGTIDRYAGAQMKIFEMYYHGQAVLKLIPCYLKTDWNGIQAGTIGMYDLCGSISSNGTPFYTNAGTGAFTKGADV